jgi:hypothetical protein
MSIGPWFVVGAKGHHGYPQPEGSWAAQTYKNHCGGCGVYESQAAPFRFRSSGRASHSHFRQLNWAFDAWFVTPQVESILQSCNITGIDFGPVLDHKSGQPLDDLRQLIVTGMIEEVDASQLPVVTCKPFNEEFEPNDTPPVGPFCGNVKYHPPTSVVIPRHALSNATDLALTSTWFGSGHGAYRYTIASQKVFDVVQSNGWRGLELSRVLHRGNSRRSI